MSPRLRAGLVLVALIGAPAVSPTALARAEPRAQELVFTVGSLDVRHFRDAETDPRIALGAEYRPSWSLWRVRPFAGLLGTTSGTVLGYGGLLLDIPLVDGLVLTPSAALAAHHAGKVVDLGSPLEFRVGAEVSYPIPGRSRMGVLVHHVSNAGLSERNPGAESFAVSFSRTLEW